jgi:hypothetical protein
LADALDMGAVTAADDHRVRLVWDFVEGLDMAALHATIKAV